MGQSVTPSTRPQVLLVTPAVVATFSQQDLRILNSEFDASLFAYTGLRCVTELGAQIAKVDAVVIWFAGRHAVPAVWHARRAHKPVITIVGGYEAQWIPSLGYGIRPGSFNHRVLAWILRQSARILTVSRITDTGIRAKVSGIAEKCRLVPNAVNTDLFVPGGDALTREGVICVGHMIEGTLDLKGWRLYWELARRMPDVRFTAVGPVDAAARRELIDARPANLRWIDETVHEDLVGLYQTASVYFQGSIHESFSLSLAEAMACGCIPVTTRGGALPEVAGDTGLFIDREDPDGAVAAIRAALSARMEERRLARQHLVTHFPLSQRRNALCSIVSEVLGAQS